MKRRIKLTESSLRNIVKESVKKALKENAWGYQRPVDNFHPDWWYYRQDVKPDYLDYDDPFDDDLDDEEIKENKQHKTNKNIKRRIKLTESTLRKIVRRTIKEVLEEPSSMIKAIMNSCGVDAKEAQEYLDSAAEEIHSWISQGVNPLAPTGYGGNYFEEQLSNLGLDYDYLMDFAQYCYGTYDESKYTGDDNLWSEEDFFLFLENQMAEEFLPLKLNTDMRLSIAEFRYDGIDKADELMRQDIHRAYNKIKKEMPKDIAKVGKPRIQNNPNGSQDFIVPIEYNEDQV